MNHTWNLSYEFIIAVTEVGIAAVESQEEDNVTKPQDYPEE